MDRIGVSFLDPLDDYQLIHRIGCGTYGDVFKVSENISWCFNRGREREKSLHQDVSAHEQRFSHRFSLPDIKVKLCLEKCQSRISYTATCDSFHMT